MIFLLFRRAQTFEVDFRSRQGGAKVAYIKAFGRFLDFAIGNRVVFWGPRLSLFDGLFWLGWCFSKKNNAFPNDINTLVLKHLGAPDAVFFYNVFKVSSLHTNMFQNVTYTLVLAIFRFPKRWQFGKKHRFDSGSTENRSNATYISILAILRFRNMNFCLFLRDVVFERVFEF